VRKNQFLFSFLLLFFIFLFSFGKIQTAEAAAPNLSTLLPVAYSSQTGTAWATTTVGNIDEGVAGADGLTIQAGTNSTSSIFYSVGSTPSDFGKMITLNYNIRYRITSLSGDTETLYVQVFKSDKTTALTNQMTVTTRTASVALTTSGSVAFTGVSTTATKADWDGAFFSISTNHSASGGADGSYWEIDAFEMTGTYNSPPLVALGTPANSASFSNTTPSLNFTGTDADSNDVEYEAQVDTASTFNSGGTSAVISQTQTNSGVSLLGVGGSGQAVGETITPASDFELAAIAFTLYRIGSPGDGITVSVYTGSETGTLLATSNTVTGMGITTNVAGAPVSFAFATPLTLMSGNVYYLVVQRTGSRDTNNYYVLSYNNTDVYAGGVSRTNNSGTWADGSGDRWFIVYKNAPAIDEFSDVNVADFTRAGDTHPFTSGQQTTYTVPGGNALSQNTYYWRVRGKDPSGSNTYGAWSSTQNFLVTGSLDHYLITVVSPQTAGVCATGTNTITAQDASNHNIGDDISTANMTYSGSGVTFFTANDCSSSTTNYTLSSGVSNVYYKTNLAQSITITATKASSTQTGTSSSITVNPGAQSRLVITLPGETFTAGSGKSGTASHQTAGAQFTIPSITATDSYFNVITGYSGAKTLAYSGPSGSPAYTTAVSFTSGVSTTPLLTTLPTAETTNITVTDGGQYGYASASLTVDPAAVLTPTPTPGLQIRGGFKIQGGTKIQ
jgi:hypothetical protein